MHWVYVLECEDDRIYVGETTKLYTRWSQHQHGIGGKNTSTYRPVKLLGIYSVAKNQSWDMYRYYIETEGTYKPYIVNNWKDPINVCSTNLCIENAITESIMESRGDKWWKVRGGKHCRSVTAMSKKPILENIDSRPMCHCGIPCEVSYSEANKYVYFHCPRSTIDYHWDDFYPELPRDEACSFWRRYKHDEKARERHSALWREKLTPTLTTQELVDIFKS